MTDFKKVFFDTAPFIYYLENDGDFKAKAKKVFADCEEADFVTSTVTVGEYLTGVFKKEDESRVSEFRSMISEYDFNVVPINWDIAEEAARIRARYIGFKMMDSFQLATARLTGCDAFVSNDLQLKQYSDIKVLVVDEVEIELDGEGRRKL